MFLRDDGFGQMPSLAYTGAAGASCKESLSFSGDRLGRGEINIGNVADGRRDTEKIAFGFEAEHVGDQIAREGLAFVAIVANVAIVKTAGGLDAVFRVDEFLLQLEEIPVGLELGIILDHG